MNKYKSYSPEQLEELFSNYLLDSWSFSSVESFSRHEKSFEMQYIYRQYGKNSATTVAGTAYHSALAFYFSEKRDERPQDLVALQRAAFYEIDNVNANFWKLQKTTPTIAECINKATDTTTQLLKNFFSDISVYESEIKTILEVEVKFDEFVTVNGVDIPLPCHGVIDLVVETKDGKIVIIDHKSKSVFTDEKELKFSVGKQAITYAIGYETKTGLQVDEVWFIENKYSQNRDKSPQMVCFSVPLDKETRRLYEAMLYEPLKRMLEAISNPDYVYLINEADNYVDKAEIHEFWAMTMMAEVGDFNIPESKQDLIKKRLRKIRDVSLATVDPKTIKKFREGASKFIQYDLTNKNMTTEEKIEHTLRTLGTTVQVAHKFDGYSSDTFLLEISAGTNISSVFKYKLDIASALNVSSIRIMKDLFVHEGKSYVAVESSKKREKNLMFDKSKLVARKIPIGLDNFNQTVVWDLDNSSTPHALICGSTGSGKSVCIISIIEYAKLTGIDEIIIFDPKFEFLPHASEKVSVYNDIIEIETRMKDLVDEMNQLVESGKKKSTLVVFDEFADAVANSRQGVELNIMENVQIGNYKPTKGPMGFMVEGLPKMALKKTGELKSLEENLRILLQKGRSSGYRVVAGTQRASVKVITGDAKVNFPVLICFKVPKAVDSKVVLDEEGAECLAGKGDGLIKSPEYPTVVRFQAFYKQ